MGLGDNLMATGMAKGAKARGKRIAFGNGSTILWDQHSEQVFRHNPNIARPGDERANDLEWIPFYKGNRIYNKHDYAMERWIWNYDFRATPGEMFFDEHELNFAKRTGKDFVLIEPNVPEYKGCAVNKTWPLLSYFHVASMLKAKGFNVRQFNNGGSLLPGVETIKAPSFRHALAALSQAALYIGPEGGLHHGAAAVGVPAVVIFGGFIPPEVTGYDFHTNLTGGVDACGSLTPCEHCKQAMGSIKIKHVYHAAKEILCSTSSAGYGDRSGPLITQRDYSEQSGAI